MKLAAGLKKRSDLVKELRTIESSISNGLIIQQGQEQSEDIDALYKTYFDKSKELSDLIMKINETNNNIQNGVRISDLIHEISSIKNEISFVNDILKAGKEKSLSSKDEIRFVSTIDRNQYTTKLNSLKEKSQNLEIKLQELNWQIDI
ncbi:unnamed protein product [Candida verbasci]|uniref:Septicolysin n=1 Tax=Candida verbasci TaxID=1227364 RepID=A0A9W4X8I6_9ASCO|nr:unnamed protein product [Candida verbasci]